MLANYRGYQLPDKHFLYDFMSKTGLRQACFQKPSENNINSVHRDVVGDPTEAGSTMRDTNNT